MKEKAISANALAYVERIVHDKVTVVDAWVENKWLVAKLSSGVYFKVLNY